MLQDIYRGTILAVLNKGPRPWSGLKAVCNINNPKSGEFALFSDAVDGLVREGRIVRVVDEVTKQSVYQLVDRA